MWKKAFSQAGWALVTNGVTESRLEVHKLRHMVNRVLILSRDPHYAEAIHSLVGDIIQDAPRRIDRLEAILDRTSYALSCMGEEQLKSLLQFEDLELVDTMLQDAPRNAFARLDPKKVAQKFLQLMSCQGSFG